MLAVLFDDFDCYLSGFIYIYIENAAVYRLWQNYKLYERTIQTFKSGAFQDGDKIMLTTLLQMMMYAVST